MNFLLKSLPSPSLARPALYVPILGAIALSVAGCGGGGSTVAGGADTCVTSSLGSVACVRSVQTTVAGLPTQYPREVVLDGSVIIPITATPGRVQGYNNPEWDATGRYLVVTSWYKNEVQAQEGLVIYSPSKPGIVWYGGGSRGRRIEGSRLYWETQESYGTVRRSIGLDGTGLRVEP